jgi:hypothetical protein
MPDFDQSRYPIGRFERVAGLPDAKTRATLVDVIEQTPAMIKSLVQGLTEAQLDSPYRPGGWTIRQVVHHVPDSHMNAYIRMKLALTEDTPTIKGYNEARWAELPDVRSAPIAISVDLLDALHRRWVALLRSLSEQDCRKTFVHPELGSVPIFEAVAMYAWHGRHHAAHIRNALQSSV